MADVTPGGADVTLVTANKRASNGIGGATLGAGAFVYLDTGTSRYKGAINSSAAAAKCAGVLLDPTTDGNNCTFASQEGSEIDLGATLTEGTWYCISSTAGKIHPFADLASAEQLVWVGYGNSSGNLMLYIINNTETKA